jgi:hypothetical protein
LANYLEINNCTSNSIQQQISYNETSLDNNTNASEIIDNEDDQDQNLGMKIICYPKSLLNFTKIANIYIRIS